jgi:acyl carrier protein
MVYQTNETDPLPDVAFRDQLDLDSMDLLNFFIALHKEFNGKIPEADYAKLSTLNGCIAYLTAHMQASQSRKPQDNPALRDSDYRSLAFLPR